MLRVAKNYDWLARAAAANSFSPRPIVLGAIPVAIAPPQSLHKPRRTPRPAQTQTTASFVKKGRHCRKPFADRFDIDRRRQRPRVSLLSTRGSPKKRAHMNGRKHDGACCRDRDASRVVEGTDQRPMARVVRSLARLGPGCLRFHDFPPDHGADRQGVQCAAGGGHGGVHDYLWMRLVGATASGWLADRVGRKLR